MVKCVVCWIHSKSKESRQLGLTYHQFPISQGRRAAWLRALHLENLSPTSATRVCSLHFKDADFDRTSQCIVRLWKHAIPSSAKLPLLQKKLDYRKDNNDEFNDDAESIRHQLEDGDSFQAREIHSFPSGQEEEFVVEKIVSRRFNPRKKQYEYLLKWEGYPPEQNTWEPAENLETCLHLLKAFEESLAKQSLNKQKMGYKQKVDHKTSSPDSSSFSNYEGRPIRYRKQKALKQVKQWCGSIKPDDAELEMLKRKMPEPDSDDDDDDPCIKKNKFEGGSDSEDSIGVAKYCIQTLSVPKITNGTSESLAAVLGLDTDSDDS